MAGMNRYMLYSLSGKKVYVAGHKGLVGSAILRQLEKRGDVTTITQTRTQLDLMDTIAVNEFLSNEKPDVVIMAAAKVGGIIANNEYPAEFIYDNLVMQNNLIHGAYQNGVEKFVFLGSVCIYPKITKNPVKENALLSGHLESTNQPYAVAKIAGIEMCSSYRRQYGFDAISLMPCNLYGYGDNYDIEKSHVIPGLIHRFHIAKQNEEPEVLVWGTGNVFREFMFSEDCASAILYLTENYSDKNIINIGSNETITIAKLAEEIKSIVGYMGRISFDTTKPDGSPGRLMDSSKLFNLGWTPEHTLRKGLEKSYKEFLENDQRGKNNNTAL